MTTSQITFWRGVCGCTAGSWCALAALIYCVALPPLPGGALWVRVAAGASIVLAAAIAGKLLALATARVFILALER